MTGRLATARRPLGFTARLGATVLLLTVLLVGVATHHAEAQVISGRITAATTGEPLGYGLVMAWWVTGYMAGYTYADASGNYRIEGLPPGSYYVITRYNTGYVDEMYGGVSCPDSCWYGTPVSVVSGSTTADIDFALEVGGSIAGRLVEAGTGAPVPGVWVYLVHTVTGVTDTTITDDTGGYTSHLLPLGSYYVRTNDRWTFVDELYNDVACPNQSCTPASQGTPVPVSAGGTTPGIDFALQRWGTIGGTVTDATTGAPVANVTIEAYNSSNSRIGSSVTDRSGAYIVGHMPTGTYYVVTKGSTAYVDELYTNIPCGAGCWQYSGGTGVAVTVGAHTSGIDFALTPAAVISGVVTDSVTGAPLSGISVVVVTAAGQTMSSGQTGVTGQYSLGGMPDGTYYVMTSMASVRGYVDELYNNIACPNLCPAFTTGTAVSATSGVTTTGIDFALTPLGGISGTVTAAESGAPLAVTIRIYNAQGTQVGGAFSNAAGSYSATVPAGSYYVMALFSTGLVDELYSNVPCPGGTCQLTAGTPVSVTAGSTTGGIDFALESLATVTGTIAGTVTSAATGAPLSGIVIGLYQGSGGMLYSVASGGTDATGSYMVTGLSPGTYYVVASSPTIYSPKIYDNIPMTGLSATFATAVSAAAGQVTSGVNFALEPTATATGAIGGTVTAAAGGAPLANVTVSIYDSSNSLRGSATTNAQGRYIKVGLPAGTYFAVTSNGLGYEDKLYSNTPCPGGECSPYTTGTGIAVSAGGTAEGVDFALSVPPPVAGSITGTVTDLVTGTPLANITVSVYNANNVSVGSMTTTVGGHFTVAGLQPGTYFAMTSNTTGYLDELYDNQRCVDGACQPYSAGTGIVVLDGTTTTGIDFTLRQDGAYKAARLSTRGDHTCAITRDGGVVCWGRNGQGQLGDGTTSSRFTPGPVVGLTNGILAIDTGDYHSCALTTGGAVLCWGSNGAGELGDGGTTTRLTPVSVSGLSGGVVAMGGGGSHTCAVTSAGAAVCWGYNQQGQLGDGTTTNRSTPVPVVGLSSGVVAVAGGDMHTCALLSTGEVRCWGDNSNGAVGDGTTTARLTPVTVAGIAGGAVAISLGDYHSCALTTAGNVLCWGNNAWGQLGDGSYVPRTTPSALVGIGEPLAAVAAGYRHTCAATSTGVTYCWGNNESGQLGDGTTTSRPTAAPVTGAMAALASIASGDYHSCGLSTTGGVYCWGDNTWGQLGRTSPWYNRPLSAPVPGPLPAVASDLDGDGRSDVVWHHATRGEVWRWVVDGDVLASETFVRTIDDPAWQIRAVADFDGDGRADLLWRNALSGDIYLWPMNGGSPLSETYVATVDPAYDIAGTGDFDGDGKADILWRHTALGEVWLWLMDGATRLSQTYLDLVDPGYRVRGVADLTGDFKADIVWHGTAGDVWIWPMDGTTRVSQTWIDTVADTGYQIEGVADVTGDGLADLVWWHASRGEVWVWTMDGTTRVAETWVATVPDTTYRIAATGDYDGDARADILWRNTVNGQVWTWPMHGSQRLTETLVATIPDTGYRIIR